jgi:subtilisin family serine protease
VTLRACDLEWCEEDQDYPFPVTLGLSSTDGLALLAKQGTVSLSISHRFDDYAAKSGTSMSAPHATGVAALLWSLAPDATAHQVYLAMKLGAKDLNTIGWDSNSGYGLIDALASARLLAPARFGLPPAPPLSEPRRRTSSR